MCLNDHSYKTAKIRSTSCHSLLWYSMTIRLYTSANSKLRVLITFSRIFSSSSVATQKNPIILVGPCNILIIQAETDKIT